MTKILLTGANGMLAYDFKKYCGNNFEIIGFDKNILDITDIENLEKKILEINPNIILNCAAYTKVDDAEDIGKLLNFQINTLGVYNLAKITNKYNIDFITISTDYVFDGTQENGYIENEIQDPLNEYGMAKYLGEKLSLEENKNSIIIRTSWLYGGGYTFKNFVNTMLKLAESRNELKVVNDQFGIPTYTKDLSEAIEQVILNTQDYRGKILHFSNSGEKAITWFDFAKEIFELSVVKINLLSCSSDEFLTKAKRPKFSMLLNTSEIKLRNRKDGLKDYLSKLN